MEAYSIGAQQLKRPILERKRKFNTPSEASKYMNLKTVISWDSGHLGCETVVGWVVPDVWKEHNASAS
jgi:hypothetical protein